MCPSEEESDPTFAAAGTSGLGKVNVVLADLGKKQQEKCREGSSDFCPERPSCHSVVVL